MNLIALFMRTALEERRDVLARLRPRGTLALSVAGMGTTLSFSRGVVVVREGVAAQASAHVRGSLEGFLALARGEMVGPLLRRQVRISGNPLVALPLALAFRLTRGAGARRFATPRPAAG